MAGETILIVEDVPESLKFAAGVLRSAGYKVQIASTAEQALSTLRFLQPNLILVDFMLPGMSGLELTARIREDPRLRSTLIVALTACATPEDEAQARRTGCNGYLTKPIDARTLAAQISHCLEFGTDSGPGLAIPPAAGGTMIGLPEDELVELQDSFLKGGKGVSKQLLASLDEEFDANKASRTVHAWIGSAGLLGYPTIAYRAREVETILRTPPWSFAKLRGPITNLARSFHHPEAALSEPPSQAVMRALDGKRVALIGLGGDEADHMCDALEQVGAKARLFEADQSPYSETVTICELVVVQVKLGNTGCRWTAADAPDLPQIPTVFIGAAEHLVQLSPAVQARVCGLLTSGALIQETLMRLRLAITNPTAAGTPAGPREAADLVISSSDESSRALLQTRLEEYGLKCRMAANGPDTYLLVNHLQPPVAVVDVDLDGFEALAAIRAQAMPTRTLFLTSRLHEDEILRGFTLGAEDFLVQPFSPVELAARIKRLLS